MGDVSAAFTSATLDALTALVENVNALSEVQSNNQQTTQTLASLKDEGTDPFAFALTHSLPSYTP